MYPRTYRKDGDVKHTPTEETAAAIEAEGWVPDDGVLVTKPTETKKETLTLSTRKAKDK